MLTILIIILLVLILTGGGYGIWHRGRGGSYNVRTRSPADRPGHPDASGPDPMRMAPIPFDPQAASPMFMLVSRL